MQTRARFTRAPPGHYEQIEKFEQLRVLEDGHDILVVETDDPRIGADAPADVVKFEQCLG